MSIILKKFKENILVSVLLLAATLIYLANVYINYISYMNGRFIMHYSFSAFIPIVLLLTLCAVWNLFLNQLPYSAFACIYFLFGYYSSDIWGAPLLIAFLILAILEYMQVISWKTIRALYFLFFIIALPLVFFHWHNYFSVWFDWTLPIVTDILFLIASALHIVLTKYTGMGTIEQKLAHLQSLQERGIITEEKYKQRRNELLHFD